LFEEELFLIFTSVRRTGLKAKYLCFLCVSVVKKLFLSFLRGEKKSVKSASSVIQSEAETALGNIRCSQFHSQHPPHYQTHFHLILTTNFKSSFFNLQFFRFSPCFRPCNILSIVCSQICAGSNLR
jgi:hypothetical protein